MNFRKGIDYIYHLEEFRQKRIGSLLDSYDLLPLIEITEKFGNELGIDIIEDMDDNSLHNLYIYLRNNIEKIEGIASALKIDTAYYFWKLIQLFNEIPEDRITN